MYNGHSGRVPTVSRQWAPCYQQPRQSTLRLAFISSKVASYYCCPKPARHLSIVRTTCTSPINNLAFPNLRSPASCRIPTPFRCTNSSFLPSHPNFIFERRAHAMSHLLFFSVSASPSTQPDHLSSSTSSSSAPASSAAPLPQKNVSELEPRSVSEIDLTPRTDLVPMPSPANWCDEVLYSILVDRFNRGSGALPPWGNPSHSNTLHGGNIRGVHEQLDYLSDLGVTALWITPVTENPPGPLSYHGYAPRNFLDVDPARGTMADLRCLVNEAHRKGIRVVLDFVANHTCHAFEYEDDSTFVPVSESPKKIKQWVEQLMPVDLNHEQHFYRRGDIRDWEDPHHALYGDFISQPGKSYKAINSENVATQDILIKVAQHWIRQTGIDGLRLDAVRHVTAGFWRRFNSQVRQYAASLGKYNFVLLGEVQRMNVQDMSPYLTTAYGSFDSVFDFEAHQTFVDFVHGLATATEMAESFKRSEIELMDKSGFFTKVIDGHDLKRFLTSSDDDQLLEVGYAYIMTTTGLPCLFYGTEQCLRDGKITGPNQDLDRCRIDMFAGGRFRSEGQPENCFDTTSFGFKLTKRLCEIRAKYAALRRGKAVLRTGEGDSCGTFSYSRILNDEEVLVVINPTKSQVTVRDMTCSLNNGKPRRALVDVLHSDLTANVRLDAAGTPSVTVSVPPQSARILVEKDLRN